MKHFQEATSSRFKAVAGYLAVAILASAAAYVIAVVILVATAPPVKRWS